MAVNGKKTEQRVLVDEILSENGTNYNKWAKEELANAATDLLKDLLKDNDPELKDLIMDYLERKLIINKLKKKKEVL